MSETCKTCGQEVSEGQSSDYFAIRKIAEGLKSYGNVWDKAWDKWVLDEEVWEYGKCYKLVARTPEDKWELDGYGSIDVSMVFEVDFNTYYKLTGEWSSYNGIEWNDRLVKVEKKERTAVYYG